KPNIAPVIQEERLHAGDTILDCNSITYRKQIKVVAGAAAATQKQHIRLQAIQKVANRRGYSSAVLESVRPLYVDELVRRVGPGERCNNPGRNENDQNKGENESGLKSRHCSVQC